MSVVRMFQMMCDVCGGIDPLAEWYSSVLKEKLVRMGWRIGNQAKCPYCLGSDPDYWGPLQEGVIQ